MIDINCHWHYATDDGFQPCYFDVRVANEHPRQQRNESVHRRVDARLDVQTANASMTLTRHWKIFLLYTVQAVSLTVPMPGSGIVAKQLLAQCKYSLLWVNSLTRSNNRVANNTCNCNWKLNSNKPSCIYTPTSHCCISSFSQKNWAILGKIWNTEHPICFWAVLYITTNLMTMQ